MRSGWSTNQRSATGSTKVAPRASAASRTTSVVPHAGRHVRGGPRRADDDEGRVRGPVPDTVEDRAGRPAHLIGDPGGVEPAAEHENDVRVLDRRGVGELAERLT